MVTETETTQNVVEEGLGGKKYTVDPDVTHERIRYLLKHSALSPALNYETWKKYGCDEKRCKNLAYLPFIPRLPSQQHADYYNRKYAFGIVVCLDHHTMRPARPEDVDAFRRGDLKFLWLEWLREDRSGDGERGKILPDTETLAKTIARIPKRKEIPGQGRVRLIPDRVKRELDYALEEKE